MKFKISDFVKHDCECGDSFCKATLGQKCLIINLRFEEDRIIYECIHPDFIRHQEYLESNLELVHSELVKEKLGLK